MAIEILEKVKSNTWQFFEDLVIDLMVKMGYGGSRNKAGENLKRTNDEGIDGISAGIFAMVSLVIVNNSFVTAADGTQIGGVVPKAFLGGKGMIAATDGTCFVLQEFYIFSQFYFTKLFV